MIFDRFYPQIYIKSVYELPLEEFKKNKIKLLVFDIDNTIAPFDLEKPNEELKELFEFLINKDFKICILSNNTKKRVSLFCEELKVYKIYKASKPGTKKLLALLDKIHINPNEAALIGDQIFTDMWCANKAGLLAILTAPICNRDQFVTKIKRGLEKWVLKFYFKNID